MADSINAKVNMPKSEDRTRKGPNKLLTFDTVCRWIKLQQLDDYTTNGLIDMAAKVPTSALPHFRRNFNLMIARVRQARIAEQRGFERKEEPNGEE